MVSNRTWKIVYWHGGDKRVMKLQAASKYAAKVQFYVLHSADDIISIEEVTDDV